MSKETLSPHFLDLIQDALLKSFWRRKALIKFLRRHKISDSFIATWEQEESKREFVERLFPKLEVDLNGSMIIKKMAISLSEQIKFPDLEQWEDSKEKIKLASESIKTLKHYFQIQEKSQEEIKAKEATRKVYQKNLEEMTSKKLTLGKLSDRLTQLTKEIGTSDSGYKFQDWFYDLVDFFEIINRKPYSVGGRQIDGSMTVEGTTYLVELKFTKEQAKVTDVDTFLAKINDKADNTMGVMVSMSGYSSIAMQGASGRKTPLILLDYTHVYLILGAGHTLPEVVMRVRRHASQTGNAFLPADEF